MELDTTDMRTAILVIRFLPRSGTDDVEFFLLDSDDNLTPVTHRELGAPRRLAPRDLAAVFARAHDDGLASCLIDLSGVNWMDSTGLGMLVAWFQAARAAGFQVAFASPSSSVVELMKVTKLATVFPLFATMAEGAENLRK